MPDTTKCYGNSNGQFHYDINIGWMWKMKSGADCTKVDDACGLTMDHTFALMLEGTDAQPFLDAEITQKLVKLPDNFGFCPESQTDIWKVKVADIPKQTDGENGDRPDDEDNYPPDPKQQFPEKEKGGKRKR